ncbi:MAG: hypothetical protein EXR83_06610 [Gammaproteobacteria bacterium]|nr:hypothetical protein [Gammaproteobacteria bacterium]
MIAKLQFETAKVRARPAVRTPLTHRGAALSGNGGAAVAVFMRSAVTKYRRVICAAGIKVE